MSEPETIAATERTSPVSHGPDRPYHVGDPIPNALGCSELRRVLNLTEGTFWAYQKAGKFKRFEFRRPVSYSKRYSGALVKRYLENENV